MKTKSLCAAGVFFLLFTVIGVNAQEPETVAKVLPANGKGVIKLLVVDNPGKLVTVKFYGEDGLIDSDDIEGSAAHGFLKNYDLSRIAQRAFRMQVNAEYASFTYEITKDSKGIVAELRETTRTFPALASR